MGAFFFDHEKHALLCHRAITLKGETASARDPHADEVQQSPSWRRHGTAGNRCARAPLPTITFLANPNRTAYALAVYAS